MNRNARSSIVLALVNKLKSIDGTGNFNNNLFSNVYPLLKFWDEVSDFPSVYVTSGVEHREYLPSNFKWGHLTVAIKVYVKGETPAVALESVISDIEYILDNNNVLTYNTNVAGSATADIQIVSIVTDEGLLVPYGVAEITLKVQYQVM